MDNDHILAALRAIRDGDFQAARAHSDRLADGDLRAVLLQIVDGLDTYFPEVLRLTREIGIESIYGGQIELPGLTGQWSTLAESTNVMSANLTVQIRSIGNTLTGLLNGQATQVTAPARGEMADLYVKVNKLQDRIPNLS